MRYFMRIFLPKKTL